MVSLNSRALNKLFSTFVLRAGFSLKLGLVLLVATGLVFKSCRKDPEVVPKKLTPYKFETKPWYPPLKLPVDNPLTEEGVMLGRMLFYDPVLSSDSSLSCSSCHRQSKGFTDGLQFSTGFQGQVGTRNAMALSNLMWQPRFFWDGRAKTLEQQVLFPIQAHNEMNMNLYDLVNRLRASKRYRPLFEQVFGTGEITPTHVSKALEQFLVTLVSFNAPIDKLYKRTDTLNVISAAALRGLNLFMTPIELGGADCFHCHSNVPFFGRTDMEGSMANNGLDLVFADKGFGNVTGLETDNGRFKIPSLRNVEFTAPYMHDGRFASLDEVLDFYGSNIQLNSPNLDIAIKVHNKQLGLTDQQKSDIIEFLKTLSDEEFRTNPKHASPF